MNIKKFLQEMAERSALKLLNEDDELFIQQLVQSYNVSDEKEKDEQQECAGKSNSKD